MTISPREVLHVADLAHLEVDERAVERFAAQIGQILEYVDTLGRVDTGGVAGTSHAIALTNAFRDDVETPHLPRDRALSNAPRKEDGAFVVPKVVG